jgi:Uma2 family endonuclease
MSTASPRIHRYTFREYLELEETSTVRHEFLEGEIYGMAGGTPEHAALTMSAGAALVAATRGGPCRVHGSDLRVRVRAIGLATYPDVTVVSGPYETDPESRTTITNPRVVVEVTSDSTEEYDRGEKLESYQQIPSLGAVVLVSHRERLIEVFERGESGSWRRSEARQGGRVGLSVLGCELVVDEIYGTALGP